jgi:ketosteroid isomerase-like protein
MSQDNVEIVRDAIEAANGQDWDLAFKDFTPSFQWDNSRAIGADNRGVFSLSETRKWLEESSRLWESVRVEIDEMIPIGEHVVVPHTMHLRGRDGIEAQARTTWLFTVRNGKIEHNCLYQEREQALEAAGLEE